MQEIPGLLFSFGKKVTYCALCSFLDILLHIEDI